MRKSPSPDHRSISVRLVRLSSTELYQALSKTLRLCPKHKLYLCLEPDGSGSTITGSSDTNLAQQSPQVTFTVYVATTQMPRVDSKGKQNVITLSSRSLVDVHDIAAFEVERCTSTSLIPSPFPPCPHDLCDAIHDKGSISPQNTTYVLEGFVVRPRGDVSQSTMAEIARSQFITLRQLVVPKNTTGGSAITTAMIDYRLSCSGRFVLARKFVEAANSLYSSPWIVNWSTGTI